MVANDLDARVVSAMQSGSPFSTYKKTILGKVYVTVLNSFSGTPEGLILYGEEGDDNAKIDLWSEREDVFFKRMNRKQFEVGNVIPLTRSAEVVAEPKTIEQYDDEEMRTVVNQTFIKLQKTLSTVTSEAVVLRMIDIARTEEKSEKIITALTAKLSEIQGNK
jgi:hypothetical protein